MTNEVVEDVTMTDEVEVNVAHLEGEGLWPKELARLPPGVNKQLERAFYEQGDLLMIVSKVGEGEHARHLTVTVEGPVVRVVAAYWWRTKLDVLCSLSNNRNTFRALFRAAKGLIALRKRFTLPQTDLMVPAAFISWEKRFDNLDILQFTLAGLETRLNENARKFFKGYEELRQALSQITD